MSALEISEKEFLTGARNGIQKSRLFKSGNDIFGSMDKFHNWLNIGNLVMGGEKPVSYLYTFSGMQLVMDELNAIEYGFSA